MNKFMLYLSWGGQFLSFFILGCCISFLWQLGWKTELAFGSLIAVIALVIFLYFERYLKIKELEKAFADED